MTSMVVFGDSMSDSGAYAALAPPGAGRFTTNPDPVWVELIAAGLGLPPLKSHVAGGSNYAEGGARVATTVSLPGVSLSRTPIVSQVDTFFAGGGRLDGRSLVVIQGGGNDVFDTRLNGPADTPADLQNLSAAATALAAQVRRLKAAGAGTVVTASVPRFDAYNRLYKAALAAQPANALFFDTARLVAQIEADPARFGIVNPTGQACRVGAIASLVCTPALYVTADANRTYLFADAIHFTGAGQQMEAQGVLSALHAPNLIGQLSYVAQSAGETQAHILAEQMDDRRPTAPGTWRAFGGLSADRVRIDSTPQRTGLGSDLAAANAGLVYTLSADAALGAALAWSTQDGDFSGAGGGFEGETFGLGLFARQRLGRLTGWLEGDYAHTDFSHIDRQVDIGQAVFHERGSTSGQRFAVAAGARLDLVRGPFVVTPKLGLRYDHGRIDGYAEQGDDATQMTFGSQKLETLVASIGLRVALERPDARLRPYLQVDYDDDLLDRDRQLVAVSRGAPVAWTTPIYTADGAYLTYGAGVTARLSERIDLLAGVRGVGARGALNAAAGFIGLRSAL